MSGLLEVRQHHDVEQLGTESGPSASSRPWSRRSSWSERTPGGCPVGPVYAHVHPHPASYDEVPSGFVDFDSVAEGRFLNSVRDAPGGNRGKLTTWGRSQRGHRRVARCRTSGEGMTHVSRYQGVMPDIGGVTLCGLVGVLAGCLTLLFKKPLARALIDKNNRLNLQERVHHFESLLWRQGLELFFLGATIIVTTSVLHPRSRLGQETPGGNTTHGSPTGLVWLGPNSARDATGSLGRGPVQS